ncbi:hypothetical protein [Jiulongibacter sediminis]|uniref:Uncharacterized protein n=1 Tax=Jiulongibacter sediminis TaxID=1605367 RepID=A0A0P7BFP6_9BACT|nr:hypothetical protein [Jiulongibacter sediminis]KPM49691.1 hypothetical protein AFM12_03635 [Jiulongibacter sediminis]TBX26730.1 hypothetical protein TK44_03640 [Jiulongibacter sediminis]
MTPNSSKPRVIKDFDKLENHIQEQIKLSYPYGFSDHLIRFTNKDGLYVSALPFETDEKYYLVRMTVERAEEIIEDDDDFDDDGNLRDDVKEEYSDKYSDLDYINTDSDEEEEDSYSKDKPVEEEDDDED